MFKKAFLLAVAAVTVSTFALTGCSDDDKKGILGAGGNNGGAGSGTGGDPIGGLQGNLSLETTSNYKSAQNNVMVFSYRYQVNSCDTEIRSSVGIEQHCRNLQSPLNRGCAETTRRNEFARVCTDKLWNPIRAEDEIYRSPGPHANCLASNPQEDEEQLRVNNIDFFVNDDHFFEEVSVITYGRFHAFVFMDFVHGKFRLKIRAFDKDTGEFLAEKEESWLDQSPSSLMLEDKAKGVRVTCWPSIR